MKVPRRLKEIVSRHGNALEVRQDKRCFVLIRKDGGALPVDTGHIATLEQWNDLGRQVAAFCAQKNGG